MAREIILEKLARELGKLSPDECRVVYVLSRIRKYLEITNTQDKYKRLNFYCNWALHTRIDRTKAIEEVLIELLNGNDSHGFIHCGPFLKDFEKFLDDQGLPKGWIIGSDNIMHLIHLLIDIYSDTPLYFHPQKRLKLTVSKHTPPANLPEGWGSLMGFAITPED